MGCLVRSTLTSKSDFAWTAKWGGGRCLVPALQLERPGGAAGPCLAGPSLRQVSFGGQGASRPLLTLSHDGGWFCLNV